MNYEEKLDKIIDYIKAGEKDPADFTVGFESEQFIVDSNTIESLDYFDEGGVRTSLTEIEELGYEAIYDGENIQGLITDVASISIEPGSQFEVAIDSAKTMEELVDRYNKTMAMLLPVFKSKNQLLIQTGYQPKTKIENIRFNPKERYKYMAHYFENHGGKSPYNMMKGSGSLQVSIDFENEADFAKKYFVASALSTFLYTTFDNSYIFEGEPYEKRNLRQCIWEYCDKNRSGIYPFTFESDLGYRKYAEQILATDSIFIHKDGEDIYTGTTKFEEIYDEDASLAMVEHSLSIVFPDVRVKKYIEVRMPDNVPHPYNFAAVALIKNIFYDQDVLDWLYEEFGDMTYEAAQELKAVTAEKGLSATYKDKTIAEWMLDIIARISEDKKYLEPLADLLARNLTPRDLYERFYQKDPIGAAYLFSVNKYIDFNYGKN